MIWVYKEWSHIFYGGSKQISVFFGFLKSDDFIEVDKDCLVSFCFKLKAKLLWIDWPNTLFIGNKNEMMLHCWHCVFFS